MGEDLYSSGGIKLEEKYNRTHVDGHISCTLTHWGGIEKEVLVR
jgi:hypothetical protein